MTTVHSTLSSTPSTLCRLGTWPTRAYLQDTPHRGSDYHGQDIGGIRYCEILEPPEATCLQAGHRKVGHLSQGNEEGDEDRSLFHRAHSVSGGNVSYHRCLPPWGLGHTAFAV